MTYTEDILKIIFGKYGEIKGIALFPNAQKAVIEFRFRLSAVIFLLLKELIFYRKKRIKRINKKKKRKWALMMV